MFAGCTDDPLGDGENTEQGGNNDGGGSGEPADPVTVSLGDITATTVQFDMTLDIKAMSQYEEAGLILSSVDDLDVSAETATVFQINRESYSKVFTGLTYNTKYYYTTYLKKGTFYHYGKRKEFTTPNVLLELSAGSITATTAQITGTVEGLSDSDKSLIEVGMFYSAEEGKVENGQGTKLTVSSISSDNVVSFSLSGLSSGTTYYYCSYIKQGDDFVYSEVKTFVAGCVSVNLLAGSITATTAQISGIVEGLSDSDKSLIEVGMIYSAEEGKVENGLGTKLTASSISSDNAVSFSLSQLTFGTTYYYCSYVKQGDSCVYGNVKTYMTSNVSLCLSVGEITTTTAQITGVASGLSEEDKSFIEVGIYYSSVDGMVEKGEGVKRTALEFSLENSVVFDISNLDFGTTYYYCSYVKQGDKYDYGDVKSFGTYSQVVPSGYKNLSSTETANCYIISKSGLYSLLVAKGNDSDDLLRSTYSASVLWESNGTSKAPIVGYLIKEISYKDGYIVFKTAETFKKGNAVIAAMDINGVILWSWHIWFTESPQGQSYYNDAGIMMDRNLGETDAATETSKYIGNLYQWGRKDPFLGAAEGSGGFAASTLTWPSPVSSDSNNGTIAYATANPTTFIEYNSKNCDWYFTGSSSTNDTRWMTSEQRKTIYDPCPAGWRVPDGGSDGVWSKALGSDAAYNYRYGGAANFSNKLGSDIIIYRDGYYLTYSGYKSREYDDGNYWSATSAGNQNAYCFSFYYIDSPYNYSNNIMPSAADRRANGYYVRCVQD